MKIRRVAVLDLGSNSFKILVADRFENAEVRVEPIFEAFEDVRMLEDSLGGRISEKKISEGAAAAKRLIDKAREFSPQKIVAVGTSFLRTAKNSRAFRNAVFSETGVPVNTLSENAEAANTAIGVQTDSFVKKSCGGHFCLFDLGGGSLEFVPPDADRFLQFESETFPVRSWKLGATRLTRECIANPQNPVSEAEFDKVRERVREAAGTDAALLEAAAGNPPLVFCGGALAVAHRISARAAKKSPEEFSRLIKIEFLENLRAKLAALPAKERIALGVPESRAETQAVALAIVIEAAKILGQNALIWSPRNLRYGIARFC